MFRSAILNRLPAKKRVDHFHPEMGRPTKELYSMAGLLFIMEFRDWTHEEAADADMFHVDVQLIELRQTASKLKDGRLAV